MDLRRTSVIWISLFLCGTFLFGCSYKGPIRHIPSEIALMTPSQTTQKELISYMGFPEVKRTISATEEEWIYYQANRSLLRRAPLLGDKMGNVDYDVAIIRLKDGIVTSSQYRSFSEEEFEKLGLTSDAEK